MKRAALLILATLAVSVPQAFSEELDLYASRSVYSAGDVLLVYGTGLPDENLVLRLHSPDGTIAKFDQLTTDGAGIYHHPLLVWPEASEDYPFGTYTVEAIRPGEDGRSIDVAFTSTSELVEVPVRRNLDILLFAPESAAVDNPVRVFVQVTADGLLLKGEDPDELLRSTHVHTPDGELRTLSDFSALHNGLYYFDYTPGREGTYVFHAVVFSKGATSHASAATNILSQDLGGLNTMLGEATSRLNTLRDEISTLESEIGTFKSDIRDFDSALERANANIASSVSSMSASVDNIEEASFQLNSLLLPIVSSIGIIVALQIVILARRKVM